MKCDKYFWKTKYFFILYFISKNENMLARKYFKLLTLNSNL
jgi:hypothetical protein